MIKNPNLKTMLLITVVALLSGPALADGRWHGRGHDRDHDGEDRRWHDEGWHSDGFVGGIFAGPPIFYLRPPIVYAAPPPPPIYYVSPDPGYVVPPVIEVPPSPSLSIGVSIPLH